ncbi:response regulator transcription factor [Rhodospirillum sp. A1_3_36]|uniref:response regulator transcription factor n=1 Tax=Rhodospirillum sp. A1_3_36 TaxID=3391666 RepID=UPI0039A77456
MTKVLLIDNHPIVLQGFQRLIETDPPPVILSASTFLEAFMLYRREHPDILIVDLSMAGRSLSGLTFIARMRKVDRRVPLLVFSMHADPLIVRRALARGANGYVHKDAKPEEIRAAFEAVREGRRFIASDLAFDLALSTETPSAQGTRQDFTNRERQVLGLLAGGKSYGEIADDLGLSYKTIANVSSILKSKLDAETLPDLIYKAVQRSKEITS